MSRFRVTRRYSAADRSAPIGFDEGAVVDVDDETAAWVNHDSPGCLEPLDAPAIADEPDGDEPGVEPADDEPAGVDSGDEPVGVRIDDMTHDELVAAVEQLGGIDGDPSRWGDKRLRETLATAQAV